MNTLLKKYILFFLSVVSAVSYAQINSTTANFIPPISLLLLGDDNQSAGIVNAVITPSRTECASPCTVVFSAEKTTAQGLDEHGVWSQLSYYWDFDTAPDDDHGDLYENFRRYTYVDGDTSFEKGHVPMVTKTFLCETGECVYNIGMRAQDVEGNFDDASVTITVKSEPEQWDVVNDTICISNSLNTTSDWTKFDKACPNGATKQNVMLDYDQYHGKLVLLKKGDTFTHDNNFPGKLSVVVATLPNQSNFKLGFFGGGDGNEEKPNIDGEIVLGATRFGEGPRNQPSSANVGNLTDALVEQYGWPSNIYIEGVKMGNIALPMSYQHVGLHDIDMDRENYDKGGYITVAAFTDACYGNPNLKCSNVPFSKGGYISSVNIVGNSSERGPGLNMGQTECAMVNFLGITDVSFRRAYEHNIRIAGWYRFNMMRSILKGQHNQPSSAPKNHKITLRNCLDSGGNWEREVWFSAPDRPDNWNDDVMNEDGTMRTREDSASTNPSSRDFVHTSRYHTVAYNQIGDRTAPLPLSGIVGGLPYTTALNPNFPIDLQLQVDLMVSHNIFERESTTDVSDVNQLNATGYHDIQLHSSYGTCVANNYAPPSLTWCRPNALPNFRNEPTPIDAPLAPGSN